MHLGTLGLPADLWPLCWECLGKGGGPQCASHPQREGKKHILPVTFQPGSGGSELVLPATSSSPCPSVHCSVTGPCEWGFGGTAPFLRGRLEASLADLHRAQRL